MRQALIYQACVIFIFCIDRGCSRLLTEFRINGSIGLVEARHTFGENWILVCPSILGSFGNTGISVCQASGFVHTNFAVSRQVRNKDSLPTLPVLIDDPVISSLNHIVCDYLWYIECLVVNKTESKARLINPSVDRRHGRLEVEIGGVWGTICGEGQDNSVSTVACRQLGFKNVPGRLVSTSEPLANGSVWMNRLSCIGNETNLLQCRYSAHVLCNHSTDLVVDCSPSVNVRLYGGDDKRRGYVQVNVGGKWGTVCDDGFQKKNAMVVCRQLGYHAESARIYQMTLYGPTDLPIWLDDVSCIGNETNLWQCRHRPIGVHNCRHREDVAVECPDKGEIPVRLVEGMDTITDPKYGRLEILLSNTWTHVCGELSERAIYLACKQMGYPSTNGRSLPGKHLSGSQPSYVRLQVNCSMSVDNFSGCRFEKIPGWCKETTSIVCSNTTVSPDFIRLAGGSKTSGRLEVSYNGEWGTVCDDGFYTDAAKVACRQMGLPYSKAKMLLKSYSDPPERIWLDEITCRGDEKTLGECYHSQLGKTDCTHSEDVSLKCQSDDASSDDYKVRLTNGPNELSGNLEVFIEGEWASVCSDMFDYYAAHVACEQLNYSGGKVERASFYSVSQLNLRLEGVLCRGHESNLKYCHHSILFERYCRQGQEVAISCVRSTGLNVSCLAGILGAIVFLFLFLLILLTIKRRLQRSGLEDSRSSEIIGQVNHLHNNNNMDDTQNENGPDFHDSTWPDVHTGPPKYTELFPTATSPSGYDNSVVSIPLVDSGMNVPSILSEMTSEGGDTPLNVSASCIPDDDADQTLTTTPPPPYMSVALNER